MATDTQFGHEPRLSELVSGIVTDAEELVKQQLALFKSEMKEDLRKTRDAVIPLVCGGVIAVLGVILFAFGIVYLLAWGLPALPLWAWFLIVGGCLLAGGFGLFMLSKNRFQSFNPLPEKSAEALKENAQWLMNPK
jgi:hypothetical protein